MYNYLKCDVIPDLQLTSKRYYLQLHFTTWGFTAKIDYNLLWRMANYVYGRVKTGLVFDEHSQY